MKHVISLLIGVFWGIIASVALLSLFMALIRGLSADEIPYRYNDGAYVQVSSAMQDILIINIGDTDTDYIAEVAIKTNAGMKEHCFEANNLLNAMRQLVDAKIEEDPSRAHYYDTAIESINRARCEP